jgi:fructosamine-3-kinase
MLRALAAAGAPVPAVEAEHEGVLLLGYVENDRVFSAGAWADIGEQLSCLHSQRAERFGWPVDHSLGTIRLDNRQGLDWPEFWAVQRLLPVAAVLDRPWRERIEQLSHRLVELIPAAPPAAFLHGDLWTGNILVLGGALAALIDPACYYGHSEVDLAMLSLFDAPPAPFWEAYGSLEPGWRERRTVYQLFPALVHLRLFGAGYAALADRLLTALGVTFSREGNARPRCRRRLPASAGSRTGRSDRFGIAGSSDRRTLRAGRGPIRTIVSGGRL